MKYEHNEKHKQLYQRGRRDSLCPRDISINRAQEMLSESMLVGNKRYAVHEGKAFCAQNHYKDLWHGYPVGWMEMPQVCAASGFYRGVCERKI